MVAVESTIDAAIEEVWSALTAPGVRARWWPGLTLEPVPGAALQERWVEDGSEHVADGTVHEVVAGKLLRFTWTEASWEAPTEVTVTLRGVGSRTAVCVTETGLERLSRGAGVARDHRAGWQWHLDDLARHLSS